MRSAGFAAALLSSLSAVAYATSDGLPSPPEPALRAVLASEAQELHDSLLPRATTDSCRKTILDVTSHIRGHFDRAFARHSHAEEFCPISNNVASSEYKTVSFPAPPLEKCDATLAFLVELTPKTDRQQLGRLLGRILRKEHVYQVHIDSVPDPSGEGVVSSRASSSCRH